MSNSSLQPTWYGHVSTARDALVLFEACLNGTLHHVARRPHDRERSQLIKSGYVFIYEENASGIKRWTDGVPWSPSRILGNFLVYRELEKPFPPGEKKRATKRSKRQSRPGEPYARPDGQSPTSPTTPTSARSNAGAGAGAGGSGAGENREEIRNLIGSLVDSYGFKEDGLVKKTMSVNVHGVHHHLVSYYKVEDVLNQTLKSPVSDHRLVNLEPRQDLVARQNFRAPLDDVADEHADGLNGAGHAYGYAAGYDPSGRALMGAQYGGYSGVPAMPSYPTLPYSSGAQYQAGMPSYAPMANHGYYGAQQQHQQQQQQQQQQQHHHHQHHPHHQHSQSQIKAEDSRQNQLPTPTYGYRPQHIHSSSLGQQQLSAAAAAAAGSANGSMVKLEDSSLGRSQAGYYAPTAAGQLANSNQGTPLHSPTYAGASGYGYNSAPQQSLPSLTSGYAQDSSQSYMGLHSPLSAGPRQAYGGQVQGQQ